MDRLLDAGRSGPLYLRIPGIANIVAAEIIRGATQNYELNGWVIMPNHVHLLITPWTEVPVLLQRIKGVTAREANRLLNRTGENFWQRESYDHLVRNPDELRHIASTSS